MRIAIVNWTNHKVGGAESYLDLVIGQLHSAGHEIAFFCEVELLANREQIRIPQGVPMWCASGLGTDQAIGALADWRPDVVYGHGLTEPELEARTLQIAPAVCFSHGYRGLCISGDKTFKRPAITPCSRRFGWQCLAHYYPHRCGGLSPATMWTDFGRQSRRLKILRSYQAIITASEHMRGEYLRQGFAPESVKVIPIPVDSPESGRIAGLNGSADSGAGPEEHVSGNGEYKLLFVGRMELLKGGGVLLDALPRVLGSIGRQLHMIFVGDGPQRRAWEERAADILACEPCLKIDFTGWLEKMALERLYHESDLLVVPSLWPEPFGLVGPEAGLHALPVAAFTVGGIPEWLIDGLNGYLAPADPPTSEGLASAILKCLREPRYAWLRKGALEMARRFALRSHIGKLIAVLQKVAVEDASGMRQGSPQDYSGSAGSFPD